MSKTSWSEKSHAIVAFLKTQYGFEFNVEKKNKIEQYLRKLEPSYESKTVKEYLDAILLDPQQLQKLITHITVPETYFFRFPEQFNFIENKLNDFRLNDSTTNARFRFWSAGCATGEEPYSIAILLARKGLLNRAEILASDISEQSLLKAKNSCYRKWSLRDQGERLAIDYLVADKKSFRLKPEIRQSVKFLSHNLASSNEEKYPSIFRNMDFILCRNVLIYLKADSIRKIFERLIDCLRPGGFLITAPVDPIPKDLPVHYLQIDKVGLVLQKPHLTEAHIVEIESSKLVLKIAEVQDFGKKKDDVCRKAIEVISPLASKIEEPNANAVSPIDSVVSGLPDSGELRNALSKLQEYIDKNSENIEVRYTYAILLMAVKRYEKAREAIRGINYLNPSFPEVHFTMGTVLVRLLDYSGAEKAFQRSRKIAEKLKAREKLLLAQSTDAGQLLGAINHELSKLHGLKMKGSQ